ncbi:hypothetical protein FRC06_005977, partial [Ceratobasidium sp. 370]
REWRVHQGGVREARKPTQPKAGGGRASHEKSWGERSELTTTDDLLSFANQCCEELELNDALKDDVLKSCKLPVNFLMTRLYSRVLSFGRDVKKNTVDGFLESLTFKSHISRRILCSLLDPNNPFFVQGTKQRFVKHIIDNPGAYNIPDAVRTSFIHSKAFSSGISDNASSHRSDIRRKVDKSIEDAVDIYTTCYRLYPEGYQCTEDHARHVAFIRMYLLEYNTTAWDGKPTSSFWEWLDAKLVKFRKKSKADRETSLRTNLKKDQKRFPVPVDGQSSFPAVVKAQDWQADIAVAVLAMAEQVESVPRQRAPRSRATSSRASAVAPMPNAGAQGNEQDSGQPERMDDQQEEDAATAGTQSEPEEEPPTGWGNGNPPNGAAMDVDRCLVGPQPGHAAGGQPYGGGSDFTGPIRNRNPVSGQQRRSNPIGRGSAPPPHRAGGHLGLGNGTRSHSPATPHTRSSVSQASSRFGTPTPYNNGTTNEDDQLLYDPSSSETRGATLGLS